MISKWAVQGVVVLILAVSSSPSKVHDSTSFDDALASATANVSTSAGQQYDTDFGARFGERNAHQVARCAADAVGKDRDRFDMLFRVSANGKITELLTKPVTRIAKCLAGKVRTDTYPKPPRDGYWVRIEMGFTE